MVSALPEPGAASLPSGTVTFLFTDIEGSTQRWERDRGAMEDAVRRHDALLRAAIGAHRGHVFKTIGDAFCAAFARPDAAAAAALAIQTALAAEDFTAVGGLPVRIALHVGTADERDADYFGPAVNRVARLLGIAHGGQVLLSGATADLVRDDLPPQASLRDLGEHRLRDLAQPERVHQLVAPSLRAEFPPLRSLTAIPNNMPLQATSFIGRESEVREITQLLAAHRLVTLVGTGGVGKTRTSLQVGAELLEGSGDGVWFVELAPLSSGEYVPAAVARAMGFELGDERNSPAGLAAALATKRALLIFDNCEHILDATAGVIAALVRGCPELRVLASSRQALGINGEATYRMPSLALPDDGAALRASDARRFPTLALFADRAAAVDNRFTLTDDNVATVAAICRRLDGIPLAIELAAARVKILSPRQIHDRLDERFRVLTGGSRDLLPRQQTLRALVDWSYDLLDERERSLFCRLGIFASTFTVEGAAAVGTGPDLDEIDVFDVLASLVDKSLVLTEPGADATRYRLLESTRAYAREKLAASGDLATCTARRLRYLRDVFTGAAAQQHRSGRRTEMHQLFVAALPDVRGALDAATGDDDLACASELLAAIANRWSYFGIAGEGIRRLEHVLEAAPPAAPGLASRLWQAVASLYQDGFVMTKAREATDRGLALAHEAADPAITATAHLVQARTLNNLGRHDEAAASLDTAERLAPSDDVFTRRVVLLMRAFVETARGRHTAAADAYETLLALLRTVGEDADRTALSVNVAEFEHTRGRSGAAIDLLEQQLPSLRAGFDRLEYLMALGNLAAYFLAVDRVDEAGRALEELAQAVTPDDHASIALAAAVEHGALLLAMRGDVRAAARLAGYTESALSRAGAVRQYTESTTRTRLEALIDAGLTTEERAALVEGGAALTPAQALRILTERLA